jgi:microcystin-dependent protein
MTIGKVKFYSALALFSRLAIVFALCAAPQIAFALSQSSVPPKISVPWGQSAGTAYIHYPIPIPSQVGTINCLASWTTGFPPLTFIPPASGGCPPFGEDMNGVLNQLSRWSQWGSAGATVVWDSAFSSAVGGYPKGAVLQNLATPSCFWISQVDGNTSNPDASGANWTGACPGGGVGGTSTGAANAQVVTTTPFIKTAGAQISFIAGYSNSGGLKINVNGSGNDNFYRLSQLGATMSVGGEVVANRLVVAEWDGTEWECVNCRVFTVGEIKDFAGSSAPNGWAFIDGSCVSQTTYADLYSVVGSAYGTCSAGNFALPDGRGRALVAQDNQGVNGAANRITSGGTGCAGTTIGAGCGAQNETVAQANLPNVNFTVVIPAGQGAHTHTYTYPLAAVGMDSGGTVNSGWFGGTTGNGITAAATLPAMSGTAASGGSGSALTTLPPLQIVTKIIKL